MVGRVEVASKLLTALAVPPIAAVSLNSMMVMMSMEIWLIQLLTTENLIVQVVELLFVIDQTVFD